MSIDLGLPVRPGTDGVPTLAEGEKCARCWQILPDVGTHAHPGVCARCDAASSSTGTKSADSTMPSMLATAVSARRRALSGSGSDTTSPGMTASRSWYAVVRPSDDPPPLDVVLPGSVCAMSAVAAGDDLGIRVEPAVAACRSNGRDAHRDRQDPHR